MLSTLTPCFMTIDLKIVVVCVVVREMGGRKWEHSALYF